MIMIPVSQLTFVVDEVGDHSTQNWEVFKSKRVKGWHITVKGKGKAGSFDPGVQGAKA